MVNEYKFVIVVFIVIGICAVNYMIPFIVIDSEKTPDELDAEFSDYLEKYKQRRLFGDNISEVDRSVYGISLRVFEDLPEIPKDFIQKTYLVKVGRSFDIEYLGEEYWKQPEFDPEFSRQGLKYWLNWADSDFKKRHWTTIGIRSYPYSQNINAKPGDSFNVTLFVSSDWSVETYQGIGITPLWLGSAVTPGGDFYNSSVDGDMFINVNVTPNEFLLGPAFPKFSSEWIKKIKFTGKIDEKTPNGLYILSADIGAPSKDKSNEWFLDYLNLYSDGIKMIELDKPYLQVFINVVSDGS